MPTHFHEDAEIFAAVVDHNGFSHAAKHVGISPATQNKAPEVELQLKKQFSCNDLDTVIKMACEGNGIAKFAEINVRNELKMKTLIQLLPATNLGEYNLFALFPQRTLPQRTRKLLEFFEQQWA